MTPIVPDLPSHLVPTSLSPRREVALEIMGEIASLHKMPFKDPKPDPASLACRFNSPLDSLSCLKLIPGRAVLPAQEASRGSPGREIKGRPRGALASRPRLAPPFLPSGPPEAICPNLGSQTPGVSALNDTPNSEGSSLCWRCRGQAWVRDLERCWCQGAWAA